MNKFKAILATVALFLISVGFVALLTLLCTTTWGQWVIMLLPVLVIGYVVYVLFLEKFNAD